MRCQFCNAEYDETAPRCPNCGLRPEYAVSKSSVSGEPSPSAKSERIWRNPFSWFALGMRKWASGKGRATRSEYFSFMLIAFSLWIGAFLLASHFLFPSDLAEGQSPKAGALRTAVSAVGALIFVPPMVSLIVRRLHDVGLTGWFFVLCCAVQYALTEYHLEMFTSIIPLCLLVWPGSRGENAYGPNPRYRAENQKQN